MAGGRLRRAPGVVGGRRVAPQPAPSGGRRPPRHARAPSGPHDKGALCAHAHTGGRRSCRRSDRRPRPSGACQARKREARTQPIARDGGDGNARVGGEQAHVRGPDGAHDKGRPSRSVHRGLHPRACHAHGPGDAPSPVRRAHAGDAHALLRGVMPMCGWEHGVLMRWQPSTERSWVSAPRRRMRDRPSWPRHRRNRARLRSAAAPQQPAMPADVGPAARALQAHPGQGGNQRKAARAANEKSGVSKSHRIL